VTLNSVSATMSTDADMVNSQSATNFIEPDVVRSMPPIFCARNLTYPIAFGVIECPHLSSCGGTSPLSVCACVVVTVICLFFFCCFLHMVAVGTVSIVVCCVVCVACGVSDFSDFLVLFCIVIVFVISVCIVRDLCDGLVVVGSPLFNCWHLFVHLMFGVDIAELLVSMPVSRLLCHRVALS